MTSSSLATRSRPRSRSPPALNSRSRSHSRARSLVYKLKFARSDVDVARKALNVAYAALKANTHTPGSIVCQGLKEACNAAMTTAETALVENDRAHQAVMAAIDDSQADLRDARVHRDARSAEMKALLGEGNNVMERLKSSVTQKTEIAREEAELEYKTFTKRVDAARQGAIEAQDQVEARIDFTGLLIEACR